MYWKKLRDARIFWGTHRANIIILAIHDHNNGQCTRRKCHCKLVAIYFPAMNADSACMAMYRSLLTSDRCGDLSLWVSSIVTVVDIVVVTRWFKFLTRDSCCQTRRKRHSHFHAINQCLVFFFFYSLRFPFSNNNCFERSILAWISYVWAARCMGGLYKSIHFLHLIDQILLR